MGKLKQKEGRAGLSELESRLTTADDRRGSEGSIRTGYEGNDEGSLSELKQGIGARSIMPSNYREVFSCFNDGTLSHC